MRDTGRDPCLEGIQSPSSRPDRRIQGHQIGPSQPVIIVSIRPHCIEDRDGFVQVDQGS
ncbi:hypothetical protein MIAR_32480 [Microbacterium arabinogalactanolyticum]|nr:hypothetical protein MIAR_32480 [Microbacterium arabinogalactanolyticum]